MIYTRDVPAGDDAAFEAERAHVILHLASIADYDDDPSTHAEDVRIEVVPHPEFVGFVRIIGTLDAEPDAPYLRPDYEPLAGVDSELYEAEVAAALRDLEVLNGQG